MLTARFCAAFVLACAILGEDARAQDVLDRTVGGRYATGYPLEIRAVDSFDLGELALSAGVPIGFEQLPDVRRVANAPPVRVTGLKLRDALRAITEIDPRYEWREMNGVIVLRPAEAWNQAGHPLHAIAPAVQLGEVSGRNALLLAAVLLGGSQSSSVGFDDSKRFVLEREEGTILDLLNHIVRAHGELTWVFGRSERSKDPRFAYSIMLKAGAHGAGLGVPGVARGEPIDFTRFMSVPRVDSAAVLDRIVGPRPDGSPLTATGPYSMGVHQLAAATGVPIGIETAAPLDPRPVVPDIKFTGLTLRQALDVMMAVDPRYEWRELYGVIVIRPARAWRDHTNKLFALVPEVRLHDVPAAEAIREVAQALGRPAADVWTSFPDTKRMSLDVPAGTGLELLNALIRAHGQLTWSFEAADREQRQASGFTHSLMFGTFGGNGHGVLVR